ncbi:GTP cyclohydrolase N terminal-domain-containing protein [Crucibulum laeve]|uniref:GTP cyclohydrolase N terminal-domain-containing protein n=1 Tax=Crucibulum laeve TaxID=68775 RepID=A0A5C3M075_9AGAR|nr:GTP cyclohydrolase N terminal-domain-containing protein [Crucibulum laeve]
MSSSCKSCFALHGVNYSLQASTVAVLTVPGPKIAPRPLNGLTSSAPSLGTPPTSVLDKEREALVPREECMFPYLPGWKDLVWSADSLILLPGPSYRFYYPRVIHLVHRSCTSDSSIRVRIICSRLPSSIKACNAIDTRSGFYFIYHVLSIAMSALTPTHKPDYNNTKPPADIPPNPAWFDVSKIVSFDPWGHLVPSVFDSLSAPSAAYPASLYIRPSIAVTKAHLIMSELDNAARKGELKVDGSIVLQSRQIRREDGSVNEKAFAGVEVATIVVLGDASTINVLLLVVLLSEFLLHRALFEDTGGMYPKLITHPEVKVFLPPIGGLTVYILSNPACMRDETKELTLRVHDECTDSDICTCKPYLTYAIESASAPHRKAVLVLWYTSVRKGVHLERLRSTSSTTSENVEGTRPTSSRARQPATDGIKKIDNTVSMSDMKCDAIVKSGMVSLTTGCFSSGKQVTQADLVKTVGRIWEEREH